MTDNPKREDRATSPPWKDDALNALRHGILVDYEAVDDLTCRVVFVDLCGGIDRVRGNRGTAGILLNMVSGGSPRGFHFCYTVDDAGTLVTVDPAERR